MLALWFGCGFLTREAIFTSAADPIPSAFATANDNFDIWTSAATATGTLDSAPIALPATVTTIADPAPSQWAIGG